MSAGGLTVAQELPSALKLADYSSGEGLIPVLKIASVADRPEGATMNVTMQIADNAEFSKAQTLETTVTDDVAYVNYKDWDDAHRAIFGKSPAAKDTYVRFDVTMTNNGTNLRFGDESLYFGATQVSVTPIDLGIVIESGYYIITDTYYSDGWDTAAIKLGHSEADVYDDPVFTSIVKLEAGAIQIMGAETMEKAKADPDNAFMYAWGPETASTSGTLIYGENAKTIPVGTTGDYTVTVNMLEGTFMIQPYTPILYAVGNFSSWSHSASIFIYERNEGVHSGLIDMSAQATGVEFKFSTETGWSGTNYGAGDEEGTLSTDGGAGNIKLEEGGIYYFTVNTTALTYTAEKITSWGVIGNAAPNGWDDDVELDYKGGLVWEGTMTLTDGEIKFRANHAWSFSLGGTLDALNENNGANIAVTAGTYKITLDLSNPKAWKATLAQ